MRIFFAGEACSRSRYSTAHGAFETGSDAAEQALAALQLSPSPRA
jgi:monoamine oxidase